MYARPRILSVALLLAAGDAGAICTPVPHYLYVGSDAQCNFSDIQAAIDAVVCPATTVVVTNELGYSGQHLTIQDKSLTISGSTGACNTPPVICDPDLGCGGGSVPQQVTIGGDGANPVFTIGGNGTVTLANLAISGGKGQSNFLAGGGGIGVNGASIALIVDNVTLSGNSGYAGGLAFYGDGSLTLHGVSIRGNTGSYAGGLAAESSFIGQVGVTLVDDPTLTTDISGNVAIVGGGGISVSGNTHLVAVAKGISDILIHDNQAGNYGGGIMVSGASADLALPGGIYNNSAGNGSLAGVGGGIYVGADSQSGAIVRIFSTDPATPTLILGNSSTNYGGGLYVNGAGGNGLHATACLFDVGIIGNSAVQSGAAVQVESGSRLVVNPEQDGECHFADVAALGAQHCDPAAIGCNLVGSNTSSGSAAAIDFTGAAEIAAQRLHLADNSANHLIRGLGATAQASIVFSQCLIEHNTTAGELVNLMGAGAAFDGCTFADDTIGGSYVFAFDSGMSLTRSIVREASNLPAWNPTPNSGLTAQYLLLNGPKLPTDPTVVYADPSFVDAVNRDYHLQASSVAIDFAPTGNETGSTDLDGNPREADLPNVSNRFGARDLGAYEFPLPDEIFKNGFE